MRVLQMAPVLALLGCIAMPPTRSEGQQPRQACPPASATGDTTHSMPDLLIRASVEIGEIRFHSEPRVDVQLTGCSALDGVRVLERRNLPEPVEPGVVYRDVRVGVEIRGFFEVRCLLPALSLAAGAGADTSAAVAGPLRDLCAAMSPIPSEP